MHRFDSGVPKCFSDSQSELRHFIDRGLWCVRCNIADQAGGYLRGDQGSQFGGRAARDPTTWLRFLDRVTLESWGEIVDATVAAAKSGDTQARAWLTAYLLGKPQVEAPTPLAVTADNWER